MCRLSTSAGAGDSNDDRAQYGSANDPEPDETEEEMHMDTRNAGVLDDSGGSKDRRPLECHTERGTSLIVSVLPRR